MLAVKNDNTTAQVIGYDASKYNALKHGVLSKYTVMHWENGDDYDSLLSSLVNEHQPTNATEEHLVEELAGIIWRKMRLRYAEMASLQTALSRNIGLEVFSGKDCAKEALLDKSDRTEYFNIKQAVITSDEESKTELLEAKECLSYCLNSEQIILESNCYEKGLNALHIIDQNKWQEAWDNDDENDISSATAEGLLSWIDDLKEHYERRIYELENKAKVKHQALGKSFFYDKELNKYMRYESHLDKKFEKTLTMLIRLQDLRKGHIPVEL
jgi:hypothetical protein